MTQPIVLFLTCATTQEARLITDRLLEKQLVACVKQFPVQASFFWQRQKEDVTEITLMMESIQDKFSSIEIEVRKIHSYETFVLIALPIIVASQGVDEWLHDV